MTDLTIREARADDLEAIIRLHEEDELGSHGDLWSAETRPAYEAAFAAIARSAENRLFVALDGGDGYSMFKGSKVIIPPDSALTDAEAVKKAIGTRPIAPKVEGRIKRLDVAQKSGANCN